MLVSRNVNKNLKTMAKAIAFTANYVEFSQRFVLRSLLLLYEKKIQISAVIQITCN